MCEKFDRQFVCTTEYPYLEKPEVGTLIVNLCVHRRVEEGVGGRGGDVSTNVELSQRTRGALVPL